MVVTDDEGKRHEVKGRLADIILWLLVRRATIESGHQKIELTCRGDSVVGGVTLIERIDKQQYPIN